MDDLVVLESVTTEQEADLIASILESSGIRSIVRPTNFAAGAGDGLTFGLPREIVVRGEDLARAREVLAEQRR